MKNSPKVSFTHKVGDQIERVGEKLTKFGSKKIGKIVYDLGNRIEHYSEKKK